MRSTALSLAVLGLATVASAQTPPAVRHAALVTPPQNDAYVYQADGRRDPFLSLVHSGEDPKSAMKHDGLRTFMLAEISVRGVMQTKDALVAMVQSTVTNAGTHAMSFDGRLSAASGTATISTYSWNFGDGGSGTGPTPAHTYASTNTYTVTLTITDSTGKTGVVSKNVSVP